MSIQPINYSQPSNKPAFTGYVDKSVVKLLDKNIDKSQYFLRGIGFF